MLFDMPNCGGCRTCELACGFRHTGAFTYASSSLIVVDKQDQRGHQIVLLNQVEGLRPACDGCQELDEPLCVQFCREAQDLAGMVQEFIRTVKSAAEAKDPEVTNRTPRTPAIDDRHEGNPQ